MSPIAPFLAPERDDRVIPGRGKPSGGTRFFGLPGAVRASTEATIAQTAGRDVYVPHYFVAPAMIDEFAFQVTTGSAGNMRIGMYRADRNWQPQGAPLVDSGDIDTTTLGLKGYSPTPFYVGRGRYVMVHNCSATPTLQFMPSSFASGDMFLDDGASNPLANMINAMYVTRAYAAFPTPGTAWTTTTNGSAAGIRYYVAIGISTV